MLQGVVVKASGESAPAELKHPGTLADEITIIQWRKSTCSS
jgi:hypothetical protein